MKPTRVALCQIDPKLGDPTANLETHLESLERARRQGAGLAVFPELSLTGYLLRDQVPEVAQTVSGPLFRKLRRACRDVDAVVGFVEEGGGYRFYNAAAYLSRGKVVHVHRKIYLPTYGMFDEGRDFAPGETLRAFKTRHGPIGILVCEDVWHATSAWLLSLDGAELLVVPSSGPTRGARARRGITSVRVWHELLTVTAQFHTAYVVYVNRVGFEDGLAFGGASAVFDPFGRVVAKLAPLDAGFEIVELDPEVLRRARTAYPLLRDEKIELVRRELDRIRRTRFDLPDGPGGDAGTAPSRRDAKGR